MLAREQKVKAHYAIRLKKGEKVMETLTQFCKEHDIRNGRLEGIGAVENISMGYYDREKREYFFTQYKEVMEVVAMLGNVAAVNGEPFLHVHAVLSDTKNQAHGGHIEEMEAAVTLEVQLTAFEGEVAREHDDEVGLKLLDL